jgi:hypothetical protein
MVSVVFVTERKYIHLTDYAYSVRAAIPGLLKAECFKVLHSSFPTLNSGEALRMTFRLRTQNCIIPRTTVQIAWGESGFLERMFDGEWESAGSGRQATDSEEASQETIR